MSGESRSAVKTPISTEKAATSHGASLDEMEELVVTHSIDSENLLRLFESLRREDCVHSWRNFGPEATLEGLLEWENKLRPTQLFFFHLERGGEMRMVAASAVADTLTREFPHPGFCVLGRCYIMPDFRGQGFYRRTLHYRLEYCRARFGNGLNAIHIGSVNERITRVITNHRLIGWPKFIHLGEEELRVAGHTRRVGDYMLLVPEYVSRIQYALAGAHPPACVVELRNALSTIESGDTRNFGMLLKRTFEEASSHGWFGEHDSREIEQLLLFCRSIPLVGFR